MNNIKRFILIFSFFCINVVSYAQNVTDSLIINAINTEYKVGDEIVFHYKNLSNKQLYVMVSLERMCKDGSWYCFFEDIYRTYKIEKSPIDDSAEMLPCNKAEIPANTLNGIKDSRCDSWKVCDYLYEKNQEVKYRFKYSISIAPLCLKTVEPIDIPITVKYSSPFIVSQQ